MRFWIALVAVAVLLVVPIAIGITIDVVSLAPPPRLAAAHPCDVSPAQPLSSTRATALRAPPLAG